MRVAGTYKIFAKSIVFVGLLSLAQLTQAAEPISNGGKLAHDAKKQIGITTSYDPAYRKLEFPRGDVPIESGVCTDVVIRAYRLQNIDLQQLVNHDMKSNWSAYPKNWGLKSTDKNIDHRRVPNLEAFFERHGQTLSITDKDSFQAGDVVTWRLPNSNLPHTGIVSDKKTADGTPLIIHNIGRGTQEENILFAYPIHKHFRY
ncbi:MULTISPECIES: DUF1287 domain-containing protein [unclassified Psychrobacter]|uniref:DUF1287 domain-containing protein n=1 Tax=unclassified Psychrobacter TaxID=196806 RepID=UPI0025B31B47|nr:MULTISPECIES: DUF1287 domain-containing protein [unclassified Psychrobacter]MDN3451995.1 DUF1287 domain-containing protein [Psychrobacter sp. APC 3350]MDN3501727.1 DUF1287 domain-containing protein [Psychrobacter sp. 5A.1]